MDREQASGQWRAQLEAIKRLGGKTSKLIVADPAKEADISRVEKKLRVTLPPVFRNSLLTFSSGIRIDWWLPDGFQLPESVESTQWGGIEYSLNDVVESERTRRYCFKHAVSSWGIPSFAETWENKISFFAVANGDFLAIDTSTPGREPVVYLSYDGDDYCNSYVLGTDFEDFLTRWTGVGCPGPERWVMEPFTHGFTKPLDPDCENAMLWRKAIGLDG